MTDPTSPSEPVESREQPREWVDFYYDRLMEAARMLAERDTTIRELRAEVASVRAIYEQHRASLLLASAEVSRLREQAAAVRRLADQIEVEIAPFRSDDETVVDRIRAAIGPAREGE